MKKGEEKKVKIYTTPACHYCKEAKEFFKEQGLDFDEYNVASDMDKREEMMNMTGQMGVPVIVVGKKVMVGFDQEQFSRALSLVA